MSSYLPLSKEKLTPEDLCAITEEGLRKRLQKEDQKKKKDLIQQEKATQKDLEIILDVLVYLNRKLADPNSNLNKEILKTARKGYNRMIINYESPSCYMSEDRNSIFSRAIFSGGIKRRELLAKELRRHYPGPPGTTYKIMLIDHEIIIEWPIAIKL